MRKLLLQLSFLLLLCATPALASDVYVSDAGAGGATGADCANARSAAFFNNSANWPGTIGPDTIVHLCGTIGTTMSMQGSGTSGHLIFIVYEPGAKLSQAVCPSTGCFNGNGKNFWTMDGFGTGDNWTLTFTANGTIQSTANGTALANQNANSELINIDNTSNVTIQNMALINAYVRTSTTDLAPSQPDPTALHAQGASNLVVHNCLVHDSLWAIYFGLSASNVTIDHCNIYNSDHDIVPAVVNQTLNLVLIHHNRMHDWSNWDSALPSPNKYHHDGIHLFQTSGGTYSNVYIYDNYFYGDSGANTTAHIFNEGSTAGTSIWVFNNIFTNIASRSWSNGSLCLTIGDLGSAHAYNNTVVTVSGQAASLAKMQGTNDDWRNNVTILNNPGGGGPSVNQFGNTAPTFVTGGLDYNFYGISPTTGQYFVKTCGSSCAFVNFATWKGLFAVGSNQEANSVTDIPGNFAIDPVTGVPGTGSTLLNRGANLTALCSGNLASLCQDINGAARPSSGAWTPGAVQSGAPPPPTVAPPTGLTTTPH
jgi:hypothetical protein